MASSDVSTSKEQELRQIELVQAIPDYNNGETHLLSGDNSIVLSPTPTTDPADPLNWSAWNKWVIISILVFWSGSALAVQSFLNNYAPSLYTLFSDRSKKDIEKLLTIIVPMVAPGELIFVPLALTFGRRFSLLLAVMLMFASTLWGAYSTTYSSLFGARVLEGLATGPTDAIFLTVLQECTFVHERGRMLGALLSLQLALPPIYSIITNYMAIDLGFKWPFILFACAQGLTLVIMTLFMPETRYYRPQHAPEVTLRQHNEQMEVQHMHNQQAFGWEKRLQVWNGRSIGPYGNIFYIYKQMIAMLTNPVVWWCALINTVMTGAFIGYQVFFASILTTAPYNWASQTVGLSGLGVLPAAFINWSLLGYASDKVMLRMARRNGGIGRPEHRLIVLIIPVIVGVVSTLCFGALAQHYFVTSPGGKQIHWMGLMVINTCEYIAFGGIMEVTYTYLATTVDASRSLAAMTVVSVLRDLISFGMSYGAFDFSYNCGFLTSFGVYAALIGVVGVGGIPVYLYGGRFHGMSVSKL